MIVYITHMYCSAPPTAYKILRNNQKIQEAKKRPPFHVNITEKKKKWKKKKRFPERVLRSKTSNHGAAFQWNMENNRAKQTDKTIPLK